MGLLNDTEIRRLCKPAIPSPPSLKPMIDPFVDYDYTNRLPGPSYGLSSFGYDARLGDHFKVLREGKDVIDPLSIDDAMYHEWSAEDHFIIPPHGFVLGYTVERFVMPADTLALATGKSTYARLGIIVTPTPLEPCWEGHVTVEITNVNDRPARVYVGRGICQFQFHQGGTPEQVYTIRSGKYQGQGPAPVTAKP